jgi:SP family sugar:H+ symporter-like MFS transporter
MLAFFTPFITGDIQYAYGYIFAGCNLAAFFVVYFFLLESSDKTLEEVDAMYLLHVRPRHSAKFEFDEETKKLVGTGINTDSVHLQNGGRKKVEEGGHGGVFQCEEKKGEQLTGDVGSSSRV